MTARASLGRRARVLVHQARQQLLVERAPVDADAHRLGVAQRDVDDRGELPVLLVLEADVAGIDAVLVERLGAAGFSAKQLVADVVEVADERHGDAARGEPVADVGDGLGGLVAVDGDAHELGAGARQRRNLIDGRGDVGGVGVGHRLHDDRRAAADDRRPRRRRRADAPSRRDEIRGRARHGLRFRGSYQCLTNPRPASWPGASPGHPAARR